MPIRILLADDHTILRQGVAALLEKQKDFQVIAEAENGLAAVQMARELQPDVAILDIGMPGLNGIEAARQIHADDGPARVLMLSMYCDKRFVVEALQAGASGFLPKDCAVDELAAAIRTVMQQQLYLSAQISGDIINDYLRLLKTSDPSVFTVLTPRERQVLQMLAEGNTTKTIAGSLGVSAKTVETYRQQLMDKLEIRSIAELTKYAVREGLTSLER